MMKVHLHTLGCPKNAVDSRHLLDAFGREGFAAVDDPFDSDIILVNTCGFIKDAKEESVNEILNLAGLKAKKRPKGASRRLVVFGCLAGRYGDELLREIPEIDALFGVGAFERIIEYCKGIATDAGAEARKRGSLEMKKAGSAQVMKIGGGQASASEHIGVGPSFAYLKIAEGCDRRCTFCVIPSIRGRFRSLGHEEILSEARSFVAQGVKELILVAQDITTYGKEWKGYDLIDLLKDLAAIEGDFRIRVLYLYPTAVTPELLDLINRERKICKYLDIPFQHSEDRILRLMGRRGTRKEYLKLLRTVRRAIPGVALRTTFIVGFPSETEADFEGLADFIEEARFDRLGVFAYSKEEGTPSAKLPGQVPEKTKQRRLDEIMRLQAQISLEKNRELVGKRFRVLIDEAGRDALIGRLCSHTPEIDGVVLIDPPGAGKKKPGTGDFADVEITDAFDYDLKARIV